MQTKQLIDSGLRKIDKKIVMLSRFLAIKVVRGLSDSVKIGKFQTKIFFG